MNSKQTIKIAKNCIFYLRKVGYTVSIDCFILNISFLSQGSILDCGFGGTCDIIC